MIPMPDRVHDRTALNRFLYPAGTLLRKIDRGTPGQPLGGRVSIEPFWQWLRLTIRLLLSFKSPNMVQNTPKGFFFFCEVLVWFLFHCSHLSHRLRYAGKRSYLHRFQHFFAQHIYYLYSDCCAGFRKR